MATKEAKESIPVQPNGQPLVLSLETINRMERDEDFMNRIAGLRPSNVFLTLPAALYIIQESKAQ